MFLCVFSTVVSTWTDTEFIQVMKAAILLGEIENLFEPDETDGISSSLLHIT